MKPATPRRLILSLLVATSVAMGCRSAGVDGSRGPSLRAATPQLEVLSALVGRFSVTGKTAGRSAGALVPHYTGTFEGRWILQGHAVEITSLGTGENQGYEATAILSYDPLLSEYQSVSATSEGSGLSLRSNGTFDAATSTLTFERMHTGTDGKPVLLRFINRFKGDGSFTLEMRSPLEDETLRSRYEHTPLP